MREIVGNGHRLKNSGEKGNDWPTKECKKLRRKLFPLWRESIWSIKQWVCHETWQGLVTTRQIDINPFRQGFIGLVLPIMIYSCSYRSVSRLPPPRQLLLPYALSPYSLTCGYWMSKAIRQLYGGIQYLHQIQSSTLPDALYTLSDALEQERAVITQKYILFKPPSQEQKTARKAILFLPGAGVEDIAYSGPAAMLSDLGYWVCVVRTGPTRQCHVAFGYTKKYLSRSIIEKVDNGYEWSIVGHSLGGFTATHVAEGLGIRKICHWAAAPFWQALNNLSNSDAVEMLIIQAEQDAIVRAFGSTENRQHFASMLPRKHQERIIPGNHCGFGSYESSSFPEDTGVRAQQQAEAVRLTHKFL